jgi:hypothetical protein
LSDSLLDSSLRIERTEEEGLRRVAAGWLLLMVGLEELNCLWVFNFSVLEELNPHSDSNKPVVGSNLEFS